MIKAVIIDDEQHCIDSTRNRYCMITAVKALQYRGNISIDRRRY